MRPPLRVPRAAPFSLAVRRTPVVVAPARWGLFVACCKQADVALRAALLADVGPGAEYVQGWVDRIAQFNQSMVPGPLRGLFLDVFSDAFLASRPFAQRHDPPALSPLPPARVQRSLFRPRSLADVVMPAALSRMAAWLVELAEDLDAMRRDSSHDRRLPTARHHAV